MLLDKTMPPPFITQVIGLQGISMFLVDAAFDPLTCC